MTRVRTADLDVASVDGALTTTRAVRRRLDLTREVDDATVLDLIDVAEQAPSGGNQGSRRWVVVRDRAVKERIAELYMATGGEFMLGARERLAGTGHPQEKVMESAAYLAEHLAEVPVIVVPTIIGVHDASGRPGLFDSVIQSVWSFCVAARARGLGTAWTTAILGRREELAEALGVPAGNTQIAMVPLAWATGDGFSTAPRRPAREVAFVDRYGHTLAHGDDGRGVVAEVDIKAKPAAIWERITDITLPVATSDELVEVHWADGSSEPVEGATFVGVNAREDDRWQVRCTIDTVEPERRFGWVTMDPDAPDARWWFELESIAGSVRVRHAMALGPGRSGIVEYADRFPDRRDEIITARLEMLRTSMQRLLDSLAADLSPPPDPDRENPIFGRSS